MSIRLLTGVVFIWLFACTSARGQAVPDTSLNQVVSDTAAARNTVLAQPAPDQAMYDSLKGIVQPFQPNPKKSALYSAILPGAGQLYNRQYWKIPVIYVGMGVSFYFLIDNSKKYRDYRRGYIDRISNLAVQDEFTKRGSSPTQVRSQLQTLQTAYKKYLDMTVLFTALGYTIQVLDALAFAHLKNFDVSKNISLKVQPVALPNGDPGMGLVMRFK